MKVGILGAGTWGTALTRLLANKGNEVTVWSPIAEEVRSLAETRRQQHLPGLVIPASVRYTVEIKEACTQKDLILFVVPSVFVRETAAKAAPYLSEEQLIVDASKGIEQDTFMTMTQVIRDELQKQRGFSRLRIAALSGPTHAEEVARDIPTMIVAASEDKSTSEAVQDAFMTPYLRVYTNFDALGVELAAAIKNIIALACGIANGLGFGDNTKAALITRGIAEIERLGKSMGCFESTFFGLSGIGDLVVTATSSHSRNNRCGYLIGQGLPVDMAVKEVGMVVEGLNALPAALALAERYQVEMPITQALGDIVYQKADPKETILSLMQRSKKPEQDRSMADYQLQNAILENTRFDSSMKRVITYGTFDMLHYGHINFLKKAKALGGYLIVALSTDEFNSKEKHKSTYFNYEKRKLLLESLRYVDLVIPEESWEQKTTDAEEFMIDTFVIGDHWRGKFDYLKEKGVEVVYLPRTPEISSRQIKKDLQ